MTYEPALRIRRRQPRFLGSVLAIAICGVWAFTFVAWGLMPGPAPTTDAPGVQVPRSVPCDPTIIPPDPDC